MLEINTKSASRVGSGRPAARLPAAPRARSRRRACSSASTGRSTRTASCIRWCAGSSRAGSPRTQRRAFLFTNVVDAAGRRYDMPVVVGALAASPQHLLGSAWGGRSRRSRPPGSSAIAHPIPPVVVSSPRLPGGGDHRRRAARAGRGARRAAGADLDAGLRRRALSDRDALRHPRSGHRHPQHGHLPGAAQGDRPARRAHGVAHRRRRRLPALAEVQEARHADAVRDRDRLRAGRRCSPGRRSSPIDLDEMAVAGGLAGAPIRVAKAVTVDLAGAGRRRDRDRGADRSRAARARGAVRREPRPRRARRLQHVDAGDRDHP